MIPTFDPKTGGLLLAAIGQTLWVYSALALASEGAFQWLSMHFGLLNRGHVH